MITVDHISKDFITNSRSVILFKDLSFKVKEGEILTILGPNGCGKSTLLNMIAGIEPVQSGQIRIDKGQPASAEHVAYMLQKDLLLPWLSVIENIRLGIKIKGFYTPDTEKKIENYLVDLGIRHLKDSFPNHLSGGERQKIALIRTLILETPILLLDEPFSAIDYNTRLELQKTIFTYSKENHTTVILISHDIDEAISVSDRIIILAHKPGGIKMELEINSTIADRNPVTARFDPEFSEYYRIIWQNYPR